MRIHQYLQKRSIITLALNSSYRHHQGHERAPSFDLLTVERIRIPQYTTEAIINYLIQSNRFLLTIFLVGQRFCISFSSYLSLVGVAINHGVPASAAMPAGHPPKSDSASSVHDGQSGSFLLARHAANPFGGACMN